LARCLGVEAGALAIALVVEAVASALESVHVAGGAAGLDGGAECRLVVHVVRPFLGYISHPHPLVKS